MKLHVDARSTSSLRVTTYLAFKGVQIGQVRVGLLKQEHLSESYRKLNPSASVPALELDDGTVLTQSLVILDWLEALHPQPAALPASRLEQAQVRALCGLVASEIHPLSNMRVRRRIAEMSPGDDAAVKAWCRHWTEEGLEVLEAWLQRVGGTFSFGNAITFADFFVAPTLLNAELWGSDISRWPRLEALWERLLAHPAFAAVAGYRA